jgi:hypothetical protein
MTKHVWRVACGSVPSQVQQLEAVQLLGKSRSKDPSVRAALLEKLQSVQVRALFEGRPAPAPAPAPALRLC